MPKVRLNEPFKELRGQIGGLIFRPMPDGTIWVSRAPNPSRRKHSPRQKEHQSRFQEAARYGRQAQEHPIYAELARGTVKTAYNMAVSDWFHPPVIHEVTQGEGRILVQASDNVVVTKVVVTVLDEQGEVLEGGEATRAEGDWWEYFPQLAGKTITAAAWDLAGNVTRFEKTLVEGFFVWCNPDRQAHPAKTPGSGQVVWKLGGVHVAPRPLVTDG